MAFGDTGLLDDFNRAGPGLGANWTAPWYSGDSVPVIVASTLFGQTGAGAFNDAAWTANDYGPDCEAYATLNTVPATGEVAYIGARVTGPNTVGMDGYSVILDKLAGTDTVRIARIDNGVDTTLATLNQEVGNGDSLGIRCVGPYIQAWYRASGGSWVLLGAAFDATYQTAGYLALGMAGTTGRWDDFSGGDAVLEQGGAGMASGFYWMADFALAQSPLLGAGWMDPEAWQWQPNLWEHNPNPPITIETPRRIERVKQVNDPVPYHVL